MGLFDRTPLLCRFSDLGFADLSMGASPSELEFLRLNLGQFMMVCERYKAVRVKYDHTVASRSSS